MDTNAGEDFVELAANIVSAYVSNNSVAAADLPSLISEVHAALAGATTSASEPPAPELKPVVPVRKSVTPDYIICLDDGKKFKSLKRHLRTAYGLTPDQYRQKWSLPADYPMVAANYAAARSSLAKAAGLGQRRRAEPAPVEAAPKARRGRKAA